jgi:hypothetical protein
MAKPHLLSRRHEGTDQVLRRSCRDGKTAAAGVRLRRATLVDLQEMCGAGACLGTPTSNSKTEQAVVCEAGIREPKDDSCWIGALAFVNEQFFSQ